jgi:hypothetical protein
MAQTLSSKFNRQQLNMKNIFLKFVSSLVILLIISFSAFTQKAPLEPSSFLKFSKIDSALLIESWKAFLNSVEGRNYAEIKELSLKQIYCTAHGHIFPSLLRDQLITIDSFISSVLPKFYDTHFMQVLSDSTFKIVAIMYPTRKPANVKLIRGQKLTLYEVYYQDLVPHYKKINDLNFYVFRFVKINNQFKFFGLLLESPH